MKHAASLCVMIFAAGCATNLPFQPTPEEQHKLQSITAFQPDALGINHGETLESTKDDVISTILNRDFQPAGRSVAKHAVRLVPG